jgi:dCTP deaminase
MSILRDTEILKEIEARRVVIDPFFKENVKDASVELLLSAEHFEFRKLDRPLTMSDYADHKEALELRQGGNSIELPPGKTIVCQTREHITLPDDIAGWITSRGRTVQRGLNLQVSTGLVQPGTKDEQLFFLVSNVGPNRVLLKTDDHICQLVLFRV